MRQPTRTLVPDADVTVSGSPSDYHIATASDGALLVLGPMPEGPVSVEVTVPDFQAWRRELDLQPGDNPLEVMVKRGFKVRGTVVDADGKPVAQAEVTAGLLANVPLASSGDDGWFQLSLDEEGPTQLTASHSSVGRGGVTVSAPSDFVVIARAAGPVEGVRP